MGVVLSGSNKKRFSQDKRKDMVTILNMNSKQKGGRKMKRSFVVVMAVLALSCLMAVPAFAVDKLIVKDAGGVNNVFVVQDTGSTGIGTAVPQSQLYVVDQTGTNPSRGMITAQHSDNIFAAVFEFKRSRGTEALPTALLNGDNGGAFHSFMYDGASYQLTSSIISKVNGAVAAGSVPTDIVFYAGSNSSRPERMRLTSAGNLGIGTANPQYLLDVNGQIRVQTTVYTSSRALKDNISDLKTADAMAAIEKLTPVKFNYKNSPDVSHIGFIAEDVPDLVAQKNRDSVDPMDIVAVLTKVVQEQNKTIAELTGKLNKLEAQVVRIKSRDIYGSIEPTLTSGN
jgi:hypothetical protein